MRPTAFAYHRVASAEEAIALAAEHGDDARFLAGGQSLVPMLNFRVVRPALLVDLNRARDLDYRTSGADGTRIGALIRQRAAELCPVLRREAPLVADVLRHCGSVSIRNRGTVGGILAHADPTAELPVAALALGASVLLRSRRGERLVPAEDFFLGPLATARDPDELIVELRIPPRRAGTRHGFREITNHGGHLALAAVAASLVMTEDGSCADAAIAVLGGDTRPLRVAAAERVLRGERAGEARVRAAAVAALAEAIEPPPDDAAPPAWRRRTLAALLDRVLVDVAGGRAAA